MIRKEDWEWLGHRQHYSFGVDAPFLLATRIESVVVVTFGDSFMGETYVYRVDGTLICGCPKVDREPREITVHHVGAMACPTVQAAHLVICEIWVTAEAAAPPAEDA